MNVPRALGRIVPHGGHRLSGHIGGHVGGHVGGRGARTCVYRSAGLIALTSLLLSGLAPVAGAAPDTGDSGGQTDAPAPVQILDLTTSSGQATEVAQSGLDGVQPSAGPGTGSDPGGGAGSRTSTPSAEGVSSSGDAASVLPASVLSATGSVPAVARTDRKSVV